MDPSTSQRIVRHYMENLMPPADNPRILPESPPGMSPEDISGGLVELHSFMTALYEGMVREPESFGLPILPVVEGEHLGPAFKKGYTAVKRVVNFLYAIGCMGVDTLGSDGYCLTLDGVCLAEAFSKLGVSKPEGLFTAFESIGMSSDTDSPLKTGKLKALPALVLRFKGYPNLPWALCAMAKANLRLGKGDLRAPTNHFKRMDWRILERTDRKEPKHAPEEAMRLLSEEDRAFVRELHDLVTGLGYKSDTRINRLSKGTWTTVCTHPKLKRTLFTFKVEENRLEIKLNLTGVAGYPEEVQTCPQPIKETMRNAYGCGKCNPRCEGGFTFTLDGEEHTKCKCLSFYFKDPAPEHLPVYRRLAELQHQRICG